MPPNINDIVDENGVVVRLGVVIGQGAEGAVYEISSRPDRVAKIYHDPIAPHRATKITVMASLYDERIDRVAAWPVGLLSTRSQGRPIGLLMPKAANRKDIHKLYSPKSRRAEFVRADFRFLVRVACNTARAFGAVHQLGCVIGDVNHGSVLVGQDATVQLIDCDSFQFTVGNERYRCEVGVDNFTPPELQGLSFRDVIRTENHDAFGLAALIFLLLFMGRHPFAGRFLGAGDMPIVRAIKEARFAYGSRRAQLQMERPPHTPDLSVVGDKVALLFERAFAAESARGGRPTFSEWTSQLEWLERNLKQCPTNSSHWHLRTASCPWCPMEAATGVQLFPYLHPDPAHGQIDLAALWRQIEGVPHPGPAPEVTHPQPPPVSAAVEVGKSARTARVMGLFVAVIIAGVGAFGGFKAPAPLFIFIAAIASYFLVRNTIDKSSDLRLYRSEYETSSAKWIKTELEWKDRAGPRPFDEKKAELISYKDQLSHLPGVFNQRLDQLKRDQRRIQLEKFLDAFEIEDATIEGIGTGRKQTLASYGIETAADVTPSAVQSVPGFGPVLSGAVLGWRRSLEARFVFNPNKGVDAKDIANINQQILIERRALEQKMTSGLAQLRQIKSQVEYARNHLAGPVAAIFGEFLQAKANFDAAQRP
jgi:DNA-binding helix-hairpin-helix protein with protein kinase domain